MKHTLTIKSILGGFLILFSIVGCNSKNISDSHAKKISSSVGSAIGRAGRATGRATGRAIESSIQFFAKEFDNLDKNFDTIVKFGVMEEDADGITNIMQVIYGMLRSSAAATNEILYEVEAEFIEELAKEGEKKKKEKEKLIKEKEGELGRVNTLLANDGNSETLSGKAAALEEFIVTLKESSDGVEEHKLKLKLAGKKFIPLIKELLFNTEVLSRHQELKISDFLDLFNGDLIRAKLFQAAIVSGFPSRLAANQN